MHLSIAVYCPRNCANELRADSPPFLEALKKRDSVMTDDHASLWVDYQNHLTEGWSLVESMLMRHIESLIQIELERLPRAIQKAL